MRGDLNEIVKGRVISRISRSPFLFYLPERRGEKEEREEKGRKPLCVSMIFKDGNYLFCSR